MAHNHPLLVWDLETSGIYGSFNLFPRCVLCSRSSPSWPTLCCTQNQQETLMQCSHQGWQGTAWRNPSIDSKEVSHFMVSKFLSPWNYVGWYFLSNCRWQPEGTVHFQGVWLPATPCHTYWGEQLIIEAFYRCMLCCNAYFPFVVMWPSTPYSLCRLHLWTRQESNTLPGYLYIRLI